MLLLRPLPAACLRAFSAALLLAALLPTDALRAQLVGNEPARSPFRDLEKTQQFTFSLGWFDAKTDAARVGPKPAPFFSLRHDLNLGGPAWLTSRYSTFRSERRVIDPGLPAIDRDQGLQSVTHHVADVGITLALTGRKSWHHTVPTLGAGVGVTSDFGSVDIGGYRFGTKFAFTFGPGVRIVLPRGYSVRVDLTNHVYQFQYPSTFFTAASDSSRVLDDIGQRTGWQSNWGLSTGMSIPLFR